MSDISVATANAMMDAILGGVPLVVGTQLELRLYTVAPTNSGGGTECPTTKWTNYTALLLDNDVTTWPLASGTGNTKTNGVIINFGTAAVTGGPEVIVAWAIYDGDVMRIWNTFVAPIAVSNGDAVVIPIGNISWTRAVAAAAPTVNSVVWFYCTDNGKAVPVRARYVDGEKYLEIGDFV
jgi:hypothetical protein